MNSISPLLSTPLREVVSLGQASLFAGRQWSDYSTAIMGTGIAIAAVSAVTSLVMHATLAAVVFVALAIILSFGVYYVNHLHSDPKMRKDVQIKGEDARAQEINRMAAEEIQHLRGENGALQDVITDLREQNDNLHTIVQGLQRTGVALQKKNYAFEQALRNLQVRVDRNHDENQALANEAGLLRQSIEQIEDHELIVAQEDPPDVVALSTSIERSQALSQAVINTWRRQKEGLTIQLKQMQAEAARNNADNEKLAEKIETSRRTLAEKHAELEKVNEEYVKIHNSCTAEKEQLQIVHDRVMVLAIKLMTVHSDVVNIETIITRKMLQKQNVDRMIQEKEKQLEDIQEKIAAAQTV